MGQGTPSQEASLRIGIYCIPNRRRISILLFPSLIRYSIAARKLYLARYPAYIVVTYPKISQN